MTEKTPIGTVLVAGAGISGIKAAIELAESGYKVVLTDASTQTGGILAKLDYQFPTDHCGMCRMLPMVGREYSSEYCMRKSLHHENIEILPFAKVQKVEGEAGNFQVELVKKARYIDTDLCNGLGKCMDVCPVEVEDEFNHGLTTRKAIYQPVPHNAPHMLMLDKESCTECGKCIDECGTGAINFAAKDEVETRNVHSIILASGASLYDIETADDAKSYTASKDVVSSLAFERMISSSGSYQKGTILRPSDGKPAKNIAWIQCMGSRNRRQDRAYCSSICCMFALKEAVLAKEKGGEDVDATIFYMDMRTFGKGFHSYRTKAVEEHGVNLVRCRVQEVVKLPNGQLEIRYFDPENNEFFTKEYDLVVMSTGQEPYKDHQRWSDIIGSKVSDKGLLPMDPYSKVKLANKDGVFICGSLMGLTDISEAMASGIAAAGESANFLENLDVNRGSEEIVEEPSEGLTDQAKVAVLICKCKDSFGGNSIDLQLLEKSLEQKNGVGAVHIVDSVCTEDGEAQVQELLAESDCNRLVIGVCQPYLYRRSVKNLAKKAGFHSSLTKLYDLQSVLRRGIQGLSASAATKDVITELYAEIEALKFKPALATQSVNINQNALIVGGGVAGMQAALSLAGKGIDVDLIEKNSELGGYVGRKVESTIDGLQPIQKTMEMKLKVLENHKITVHLNAEVQENTGSLGAFESKIYYSDSGASKWIHHGAAIMATGGQEGKTEEYSFNDSDKIITQEQLKDGLQDGSLDFAEAEEVVMIQCAGSREEGKRNYCSRVCCMWAVSNAIAIKEKNPETRVIVLYRDMMTYGFNELHYTKARQLGVLFVNYSLDSRPEVEVVDGKTQVKFTESILNEPVTVDADYVVLSTGVTPNDAQEDVAKSFGLELTEGGFFAEADSKWRPIEFQKMGLFVAGAAHSPMPMQDVLMQAEAAAQKAYSFLQGKELQAARTVSSIKDALCVRCKICINVCPYKARTFSSVENKVLVDPAACQGCGMCSVSCRNNASEVCGWNDKQLMGMLDQKLMDDLNFL